MCVCVCVCVCVCSLSPACCGKRTRAVLCSSVSTVEACSWIGAPVEVPPHGVKEHKEGKKTEKEERESTGRSERGV